MSRYRLTCELAPDEPWDESVDADSLDEARAKLEELLHATIPESAIELLWEGDDEPEDRRLRRLGTTKLPGMDV